MTINDFKFTMAVDQAFEKSNEEGIAVRYVGGRASGTALDLDGERMAKTALEAFQKAIKEGIQTESGEISQIPLRSGHRKEWDDVLGWVVDAHIDEANDFWIVAELEDTARANDLYKSLTTPQKAGRPNQLGFSVGGKIQKASLLWDSELKRSVRTIEDVALKEISVVGRPAFPTAYVEALTKSVNWDDVARPDEEPEKEHSMTLAENEAAKAADETQGNVTEPVVEEVSKETTEVTTTEVSTNPAESTEVSVDYGAQIASLTDQVNSLTQAVQILVGQSSESNKSEAEESNSTDVQEESAEKAATEQVDVAEAIAKAMAAAFQTFTETVINPINEKLDATKSVVEEIGAQGVDKSISVTSAKENDDPIERFIKKYDGATRADLSGVGFMRDIVELAIPGAVQGNS